MAKEREEVYQEFYELVNMAPKELEEWLETEASQSAGQTAEGEDESKGHRSGRRIVEIKRKNKEDLVGDDYEHMRKVTGYVKRHLAQQPSNGIAESTWRYSLMNWGHDPCKNDDVDCP